MPVLRRHVDFALPALGIAAVSVAWSAWAVGWSGHPLEAAWVGGTLIPNVLDAGAQPWRLLTAGWLHTDVAHLLSNLPGLLVAGMALARMRRGVAVYPVWAVGALAGCLASWLLTRTWAHGASAGSAALAAAVLWVAYRRWGTLDKGLRRWAVFGSVPWLLLLIVPRSGPVDHWAHLAGVIVGPLVVGAGRRVATGCAVAHGAAFALMIWTTLRPVEAVITLPVELGADLCRGPAVTDGLTMICPANPLMAAAAGRGGALVSTGSFEVTVIEGHTFVFVPGRRAAWAMRGDPGRFFDGSANPR